MFKKLALIAAAVLALSSAQAADPELIYANHTDPLYYFSDAVPTTADQVVFTTDPAQMPTTIQAGAFLAYMPEEGTYSYDAIFRVYDSIDTTAPAGTSPFRDLLFEETFQTRDRYADGNVAFYQGQLADPAQDLAQGGFIPYFASEIVVPDSNAWVEVIFTAPGDPTLFADGVYPIWSVEETPLVGKSNNGSFIDVTGDGILALQDNVRFSGGTQTNVYLELYGHNNPVIPEPGTMALLGAGLLPLLGIRRRK